MAEIFTLHPVDDGAQDDLIDLVKSVLERVEAGETVGVAFVEVSRDRGVSSGYAAGCSYHLLNSGAARLANRLASED